MPLKVWAPYDRLDAADLNSNFSLAAAGQMPGIWCNGVGTPASVGGAWTDIPPVNPSTDAGGFWNGTTKKAVIPAGLGGLYLAVATILVDAGSAVAVDFVIGGMSSNSRNTIMRNATSGLHIEVVSLQNVGVGTAVGPQGFAYGAAGNCTAKAFTLIRLARGIEVIGS